MIIKKLRLNNFKRFALKNVMDYVLIPDSNLTIFTWKNGEGKSSIIQQLNPIPNDFNKDFLKDGFKELEFIHNNKTYFIKESKGHYSILENGVELNPSNNKKTQEQIVFNLFNLNPKIMSVINGYTVLSRMSPSERKHWISHISNVDYTYPTKVYLSLMERKRDIVAWKKLALEKSAELNKLLLKDEDIKEIEELNNYLKERILELLKTNKEIKHFSLEAIETNLDSYVKIIKNINISKDVENIDAEIEKLAGHYYKLEENLKEVNRYLEELSKSITDEDVEVLNKRKMELQKFIQSVDYTITENNILHYKEQAVTLYNYANNLLSREDSINNRLLDAVKVDVPDNIEEILKNLKTKIDSLNVVKEQYLNAKDLKYLKCNSCNSVLDFTSNIQKIDIELTKLEPEYKELTNKYRDFVFRNNLLKESKELKVKFDELLSEIRIKSIKIDTNVETLSALLDNMSIYISNLRRCESVLSEIKDIDVTLTKRVASKDKTSAEKDKERYLEYIKGCTERMVVLKERINNLKNEKKNIEVVGDYREKIKSELSNSVSSLKNELNMLHNESLNKIINVLQNKVKELTDLITKHRHFLENIENYKKSMVDYEEDLKDYNILLDVLSPTNGLIAKSINSLITTVVNEMNTIINSVWTYNMKILPCDLSEGDLDYKFKVEVNDDFVVEDISKLSSSMQEIVDLAFRLVFIRYCKIGDIPIILDEFGRTMDREHRINAFNLIDNVICKNFEQVFLVSHFEEMFGRFKNATFPVLK